LFQFPVELLGLLAVLEPSFAQFTAVGIDKRNCWKPG
jgi:hypothetical protein